ncbi:cupin domain-containing protein [Microbacterium sp. KUDC0406]|uniref:cupin domain-containing protein n=1 Tax=Microbacterium sp. KUDC0406 TaxID=2909588 RepID=UPI001F39B05B|nr:cupin domain-containing protein [Microbacterium sp. KUDC0406]UJP11224.1 cupin domain-containing protein [Microbacterium sp. KUDC0406]
MTDTLTLNGSERIAVQKSGPGRFEVQATYQPRGERPPMHVHPAHTEEFTVLSGVLRVDCAGSVRDYRAGESFDIASGVAHRMWNGGDEPATVRWISAPAARVESFFRAMDALHRAGTTSLLSKAGVLREYKDVMRPSSAVTRLLVNVLGALRPAPPTVLAPAGQEAL